MGLKALGQLWFSGHPWLLPGKGEKLSASSGLSREKGLKITPSTFCSSDLLEVPGLALSKLQVLLTPAQEQECALHLEQAGCASTAGLRMGISCSFQRGCGSLSQLFLCPLAPPLAPGAGVMSGLCVTHLPPSHLTQGKVLARERDHSVPPSSWLRGVMECFGWKRSKDLLRSSSSFPLNLLLP